MAQVSGIEIAINADTSGLEKGIGRAQGAISSFAKGAAASLAGALSIGMFVQAGRAAAQLADDIGKMSQKVGMTTEALSKLTYAAKLSDVSLGELQVGVQQLSKNMEAGSEGLLALGISATDASGNLRSTNEVFLDIAEAFAGMEDGAGKTAIAMNIFGRSGAQLIPMLNAGRSGLAQMGAEAQRFGVVISSDAAKAAEDFNDNLTRFQTISDGIAQSLVNDLLPPLNDVLNVFLDYLSNGDGIAGAISGIKTEFEDLARVVNMSAGGLETLRGWYNAIDDLARKYGPFSGAAQNGFFGMFPTGANPDPTGSLASIDAFNPVTVNREGKGSMPLAKAPSLSAAADKLKKSDGMRMPGIPGSAEIDPFFIDRIASIQEGFKSEREILIQEYAANEEVLRGALENQLLSEEEYYTLSQKLAQDHATALANIQKTRLDGDLAAASSFFGSMAQAAQSGGKKLLKVAKASAAAQAIVDTIRAAVNAMNDPTAVTPIQKFANYAAVFAKGMAAVAAIKGVSEGGGGGGGKGGGGGGAARGGGMASAGGAAAAPSPTTTFSFTLMNDPMGFGEKFARQFIDQLNSTQRNGGTIRGVIA